MCRSKEVQRESWTPEKDIKEVEDTFQFNNKLTPAQETTVKHVEDWGRAFALELAAVLPEGPPKQVAINSVMSAVLWAKHSLTHRSVEVVSTGIRGCPAGEPGELGEDGDTRPA
jgi:hypothetical protein